VYETDPVAYAALDPDGNGLACEELQPGAAPAWWTNTVPAGAEPAALASVTDGDTIRAVVNGVEEPVRLILIDTPETRDPNDPPECYGQEATAYLSWLLSLGGQLYLERDVSERDQFDRLLRYVWLDFGDGEAYLVNEAMARSGYAAQSTFPPDVKYEEQIRDAARFAREHGYGLWSYCQTDAEGDTNELTGAQGIVAGAEEPVAPEPAQEIISDPVEAFGCDPSYPDGCIPPPPPDLDCGDVPYGGFTVYPPDPHRFDGDSDGIGCE
jgi:micrococcal nuclease